MFVRTLNVAASFLIFASSRFVGVCVLLSEDSADNDLCTLFISFSEKNFDLGSSDGDRMVNGEIGDGNERIFLGVKLLLLVFPPPSFPLMMSLLKDDRRRYISSTNGEHRRKNLVSTIDGSVSKDTVFCPVVLSVGITFVIGGGGVSGISLPKCSNRFSISTRTNTYPVLRPYVPSLRDTVRRRMFRKSRIRFDTCNVPFV